MSLRRDRAKGRGESGSFLAVPHAVLNSLTYLALSAHARMLLFDIASAYNGRNNGDLSAAWTLMERRGWKSRDTLNKARKELLHYGFIDLTRQGGLHKPSLYALTWLAIDECKGKPEVQATRVASGYWKEPKEPFIRTRRSKDTSSSTLGVSVKHAGRVNSVLESSETVPVTTPGVSKEAPAAVA